MKFEYHTFEIEPYLQAGKQPEFMLTKLTPNATYATLTNPSTGDFATTGVGSAGVRVPVFAVATFPEQESDSPLKLPLSSGSLLTALGLEVALRFLYRLPPQAAPTKAICVIATQCHELPGRRFRAYFGLTLEFSK